jgi:exonuclease III
MNFLSWNVRGLTDLPRKYYVRDTRRRLQNLDVLCLQEVKILGFLLNSACRVIWPEGIAFSSQHEAGRGGVITFLSPRLHSCVIAHGSDPMQRVTWILLSLHNHSFGVINVYAPNDAVERSQLWYWLADNLPPATWVMCGDFNMVELATDKEGLLPFRWTAGEREAWYHMRNKLGLFDPNTNRRQ